ncbi:hypothetical protein HA402_003502 [Bradysia odoriphaga]|nr:hypothetical protein HA402_003502 [Bradysia odoriphaga]
MGRRKWKLYQEVLARSQSNSIQANSTDTENICNKEQTIQQEQLDEVDIEQEKKRVSDKHIKDEDVTETEPSDITKEALNGKLVTVNERGDFVTESGSVQSEPDLVNRTSVESDSDSSDCSDAEIQDPILNTPPKSVTELLRNSLSQHNMTSYESMAAQLATIASLNGFPSMYPGLLYNQFVQQMQSAQTEPVASVSSPNAKPSSSATESTAEQPLDLSAKPSNAPMFHQHDSKQVYRAKPRMSTVPGRRTYTEEELQSALQDILSGKLGTRRAAVQYGIPRSTLRNKVYKLAMEQKREATLLPPATVLDLDNDNDDNELSGNEDDKDIEKVISNCMSQANVLRLSSRTSTSGMSNFPNPFDNSSLKQDVAKEPSKPPTTSTPQTPQTPPIINNPWLDPVVLQNLILGGFMQQKYDDPAFQELFRNLLIQQQELMKEQMKNSLGTNIDAVNNGNPINPDVRNIMQNFSLLHHQQMQNRAVKRETPETTSSNDPGEDAAVILKIPSFKPLVGSSSGKNGDNNSDTASQTTPPIPSRSPLSHNSDMSPSILRSANDSQSPPINVAGKSQLSLRDVIAKSITRTFNQQSPDLVSKPSMDHIEPYKGPSISVIKNLGGTDISRFATSPNMMGSMNSNANMQSVGIGGKGTRPKRGKYRNYDRDSLVEAVKAVQRGEMSVHRAGSYYGVPHSTLEYKVKERHLMRPRKREPKPQPLDGCGNNSSLTIKSDDITASSSSGMRAMDKSKPLSTKSTKSSSYPATPPNGLKMGMFDPAQLQYGPHLFWPHPPGYSGLPLDFTRSPATGSTSAFPANAESYFASQMMHRFQDDARQSGVSSSMAKSTTISNQSKSARELAESLYDGASTNGSFLDGIIRHSLDRKTGDNSHGTLLDQLVKNNRHSDEGSSKRPGSPINFAQSEIKRERASPSSGETDKDSCDYEIPKESVETLMKYREILKQGSDEKCLKSSVENLNGNSPINKVTQHSEKDDSS